MDTGHRRSVPVLLAFCLLLFLPGVHHAAEAMPEAAPAAGPFEPKFLAPSPFCEASAVLVAPWDDDLIVVADNERHQQLYVFKLKDGRLDPDEIWQMPAKNRPRDVEALARLGDDLVVVGSLSRNNHCERKEDRQRLRRLTSRHDGTLEETCAGFLDAAESWKQAMANGGALCLSTLFASPPPAGAGEVCEALAAAEGQATDERCEVLNVEGAFGAAHGRLWLGLRAPLAGGRALMLRLTPGLDELRFDSVVLLDLKTRGIRELALAGDHLYGIAGPTLDADVPSFALFRIAVPEMLAGGQPPVEILRSDLVRDSEGLLIRDRTAYVFVDGDEKSETGTGCGKPAGWYTVELP